MQKINKLYPHVAAIFGFIIVSILYFYPVLQGNKIFQSDIVQYTGMAKEQNDFRNEQEKNLIGRIVLLEECQPIS